MFDRLAARIEDVVALLHEACGLVAKSKLSTLRVAVRCMSSPRLQAEPGLQPTRGGYSKSPTFAMDEFHQASSFAPVAQPPAAARTGENVDLEGPSQQVRPGEVSGTHVARAHWRQKKRAKPRAMTPQVRYSRNSRSTKGGSLSPPLRRLTSARKVSSKCRFCAHAAYSE